MIIISHKLHISSSIRSIKSVKWKWNSWTFLAQLVWDILMIFKRLRPRPALWGQVSMTERYRVLKNLMVVSLTMTSDKSLDLVLERLGGVSFLNDQKPTTWDSMKIRSWLSHTTTTLTLVTQSPYQLTEPAKTPLLTMEKLTSTKLISAWCAVTTTFLRSQKARSSWWASLQSSNLLMTRKCSWTTPTVTSLCPDLWEMRPLWSMPQCQRTMSKVTFTSLPYRREVTWLLWTIWCLEEAWGLTITSSSVVLTTWLTVLTFQVTFKITQWKISRAKSTSVTSKSALSIWVLDSPNGEPLKPLGYQLSQARWARTLNKSESLSGSCTTTCNTTSTRQDLLEINQSTAESTLMRFTVSTKILLPTWTTSIRPFNSKPQCSCAKLAVLQIAIDHQRTALLFTRTYQQWYPTLLLTGKNVSSTTTL